MTGISVKTGFLWIGITFLEESLMLIQESRKVKLIISRKRNWPVRCTVWVLWKRAGDRVKYSFSVNTMKQCPIFQGCSSQPCPMTAAQLWGSVQQSVTAVTPIYCNVNCAAIWDWSNFRKQVHLWHQRLFDFNCKFGVDLDNHNPFPWWLLEVIRKLFVSQW